MQKIKILFLQFVAGMLLLATLGLCGAMAAPGQDAKASLPAKPKMYVAKALITAYCPCKICCGPKAHGRTSQGRNAYKTNGVAVDPSLIPYWSIVTIDGVGDRVADDTGGAMRGHGKKGIIHVDVRMRTHKQALAFGVKEQEILIHEPQ